MKKVTKLIIAKPDQAAEWVFQLLKERPWLLAEDVVRHDEPEIEEEAVSFLLALAEQDIDDWQGISQAARETVTLLLTDFLARLMHPQSPSANRTWQVTVSPSKTKKALEIIAYEIRQSHPHFSKPH